MKYSWFIIIGIFLVSCQSQYTKNVKILEAEALLNPAPDSALNILLSIPRPEELLKADYAAWCLHYTHALFKLHKDIHSDSLIRIATEYYENSKLYKESGTAYYLQGCILELHFKYNDAMKAYKQAEYKLHKTDERRLKAETYYNMGRICMEDELYIQSLDYFKKSLKYSILLKDNCSQTYVYREISEIYNKLNYPIDSVMYYSALALKLSNDRGDTTNYYSILSQQGEFYYNRDNFRSKKYLLEGFQHIPALRSYYAAFLSLVYSKLNKTDSARYYLQISLADTLNLKVKTAEYLAQAYVAIGKENYNQAFKFLENAYLSRDSVFQKRFQSQLYWIDKQYDLTQKERENTELKTAIRNYVNLIAISVIVLLITLIIILLIKKQHKKTQVLYQMEKQRMEYEIKTKEAENEQKHKLLLTRLQNKVDNTLRFNRLKKGLSDQKKEAFLEEIAKQLIFSDREWQYYIDEINNIFEKKITNLPDNNNELTRSDFIVITHICLRLDISDSCNLLNMSKDTMYHRRSIIKDRIGLNREVDLEEWVIQNITLEINPEDLGIKS